MKIIIISHMYPSSYNSVGGIFVHKQVKAMIADGHEVKVISPVPFAPFPLDKIKTKWKAYAEVPKKEIVDGVEVYYPRYMEFPGSYFLEYSGYFMYLGIKNLVMKIYKNWKFDIIHSHVALPDGFCAMLLKRDYSIPFVVTIHGQDFQFTIFKNQKCKKYLYKVLNNADKIITVSNKLKNIVSSEDFYKNIIVINNGIDPADCVIEKGKDIIKKGTNRILLSVSNLNKTKGIDLNIIAMSELIQKYKDIRYYIIGDGPERTYLMKLVNNLKLTKYVSFLGRLPYRDVMQSMSSSDIFCLPSWQEGFGVVYIEAMAHSKPVIAIKGEGIEDVIKNGQNGFLVKPHDVKEIVNTIDFLLSHPKEANIIGENAQSDVINDFTWSKCAFKNIKVYQDILYKKE